MSKKATHPPDARPLAARGHQASRPALPKVTAVHPFGSKILVEILRDDEIMGTSLYVGSGQGHRRVDGAPQAVHRQARPGRPGRQRPHRRPADLLDRARGTDGHGPADDRRPGPGAVLEISQRPRNPRTKISDGRRAGPRDFRRPRPLHTRIRRRQREARMSTPTLEDYKQFFEETPVALIRTDLKTGEFLLANQYAAHLLGFDSVEEMQAKETKVTDFYPGAERKKLIQQIRKNGVVKDYELKLTLADGHDVHVSARLRINCGGTCIEGSLIDITSFVELRQKCLLQQKEISRKLDTKLMTLAG
jgi:PAS domain S-box-containing protein